MPAFYVPLVPRYPPGSAVRYYVAYHAQTAASAAILTFVTDPNGCDVLWFEDGADAVAFALWVDAVYNNRLLLQRMEGGRPGAGFGRVVASGTGSALIESLAAGIDWSVE